MKTAIAALVSDNLDVWTAAVERKSGAGRGGGKKLNLYGIERLRALILDLAVRGQLVRQDADDEPVEALVKSVRRQSGDLNKAGNTAKTRKVAPASIKPPFEIPTTWQWMQIAEIGHDWGQWEPDQEFTYIDVGSIDQTRGLIRDPSVLSAEDAPSRARKIVRRGTVIYSTVRPYLLNIAIVDTVFDPSPIASTAFAVVHPFDGIEADFLYRYLRSPAFVRYVEGCQTGIAYPAINDRQFFSAWFPLPPTAEQQRIVAKVDELMALCDALEAQSASAMEAHQTLVEALLATLIDSVDAADLAVNWAELEIHFNVLFATEASVETLKQVIFSLAARGVLVAADAADIPSQSSVTAASEAKAVLSKKEGLKARPAVQRGRLACSVDTFPRRWTITDFDSVFVAVSGVTKGQKIGAAEAVEAPYLRVANVQRGYLELGEIKTIIVKRSDYERYQLRDGDVLMTEGGDWDKLGRAAIWRDEIPNCLHQNHLFRLRFEQSALLPEWVVIFVNSTIGREYFSRAAKQTTNLASINMTQLRSCPLPVPPYAEQQRIVAKVDELMAFCEALKAGIANADGTQRNLADAIVERAAA